MPIADDYTPIRDAIAVAVGCMNTPDDAYNQVTNAEIECALYASPQSCRIERANCGGGASPCTPEDLFPRPISYRLIPRVFRAENYGGAGNIDVARLKADFQCAALVGTRGYGIEKGLSAAVEAVSPANTGGVVGDEDADTTAPNHGLLRKDAAFGVVFVTDENDCSHDGSLREDTACGGDVCEHANLEGADSPLIEPSDLALAMVDNLRATKGNPALNGSDIYVASLHATARRFDGEIPSDAECGAPEYTGIGPSCRTNLGVGFSGDRYERFLRAFPGEHTYPKPDLESPDTSLTGWMCSGDFTPALSVIGDLVAGR